MLLFIKFMEGLQQGQENVQCVKVAQVMSAENEKLNAAAEQLEDIRRQKEITRKKLQK